MRFLRQLLFALVPLALCVAVVELVLGLLGLGRPAPRLGAGFELENLHVAFDSASPAGWRAVDRPEPRERVAGRKLVVLLGGSNTQNFPHALLARELETRLAELVPGGLGVDVVNLGRAGFGSERVAKLCAQALELDPDLVLVYSGHNEILERQFHEDFEREWSGWSASLAVCFTPLRAFQGLVAAFSTDSGADRPDGQRGGHAGNAPAQRAAAEEAKFEAYTGIEATEQLERFRVNLEHMVALARERGVRIVFSTAVWNALSPPFVSNRPPGTDDAAWRETERLLARMRAAWPQSLAALDPEVGLMDRPYEWSWNGKKKPLPPGWKVPVLRTLASPLAERGPLWPAPEHWQPSLRAFMSQIADFCARRVAPRERAALDECARDLARIQELAPDLPDVLFRLGVLAWLDGEDEGVAADYFDRAAALDRAPRKASNRTNDIVRSVAARTGAPLCDADRLYRARTPGGIVGWEVMLDHCHLQPGGYAALMSDLADFLAPELARGAGTPEVRR